MNLRRDIFGHAGVAHTSLRHTFAAERYSDGALMQVGAPVADLTLSRDADRLDRQVIYGHPVCLLDPADGLARDETSGYVGYIDPGSLAAWVAPTHRVTARTTLLFSRPDIKTPGPVPLSCGSLLAVDEPEGGFARTQDGLYAIASHICPLDETVSDLAETALKLLGTPYLWGGNAAFGIDCSGLVQLAAQAAGLECPGDSDQQMAALGTQLVLNAPVKRGDLYFWPGHVAMAADEVTLVHANAHTMAVSQEPLDAALSRIDAQGNGPLLARKRV